VHLEARIRTATSVIAVKAMTPELPRSVPLDAESLDECEALLKRAIEMVRGPTRGFQTTQGLADGKPATPPALASSAPVHSESPESIMGTAEADRGLHQSEAVLNLTIEMVKSAARRSETQNLTEAAPEPHPQVPSDDATR
jgi:hypothetical protein